MTSAPRDEADRPVDRSAGGRPVVIRTYPQGPSDEWDGRPRRCGAARTRPSGRGVARPAVGRGAGRRRGHPHALGPAQAPPPAVRPPMVLHVLDALAELPVDRVVVVVGHRAEWVTKTLVEHAPPGMAIEFVEQVEQRGTGDAMSVALTGLPDDEDGDDGDVVVLPGRHAAAASGHPGRAGPRTTGPRTPRPPC